MYKKSIEANSTQERFKDVIKGDLNDAEIIN